MRTAPLFLIVCTISVGAMEIKPAYDKADALAKALRLKGIQKVEWYNDWQAYDRRTRAISESIQQMDRDAKSRATIEEIQTAVQWPTDLTAKTTTITKQAENNLVEEYVAYRMAQYRRGAAYTSPSDYAFGPTWRLFDFDTRGYIKNIAERGWQEVIRRGIVR